MKDAKTGSRSVELDFFGLKFRTSVYAAVALLIVLAVATLLVSSAVLGLLLFGMISSRGGHASFPECMGFTAVAIMAVAAFRYFYFSRE